MQATPKETPQSAKQREARRDPSPKAGYFFGDAEARQRPFTISKLISGLSLNFKATQLAKARDKKPASKELSVKSGLSPGGPAKRGSSQSRQLADLKAQLVKTEGCLEAFRHPRNPITNGKNAHLKHFLSKLSSAGFPQDPRPPCKHPPASGQRQPPRTPAALASKHLPTGSPKSDKLAEFFLGPSQPDADFDLGSRRRLLGGSFRCSDIPEDFEEEVTLKSFKDSAFDRSAIQQVIEQRMAQHRPLLLKEETDSDYIRRIKTTFRDNKQLGSFEAYESRKTSPLLSAKTSALEKSATLFAGRSSSKQASKERVVQLPGDRKSSKNLDFSKFEADRPHFIQIEPRHSSRSKQSSPQHAQSRLPPEEPNSRSPQCAKLRQFLESHASPKHCFQTPLLSQQKSRFIHNLLLKNGIRPHSSANKQPSTGAEYFSPLAQQLGPEALRFFGDSANSSPAIKHALQGKNQNSKSSTSAGLPVFHSFKHTRQRTTDDACCFSLAPLPQTQTLKHTLDGSAEDPALEKSASNKTLKRGASGSAKNAQDARLAREQSVCAEESAVFYKLERESAARRFEHPPKSEIDSFRQVQALVLQVLRQLKAGRSGEELLGEYVEVCQQRVFELFEVNPDNQHLFQADAPRAAFARLLKLERWSMLLLFAHRLVPEDSESAELQSLFVQALEVLVVLHDLQRVWLHRIERASRKDWGVELQTPNQALLDRSLRDLNFFKHLAEQTRRFSELLAVMYTRLMQH